jgi:hypothetical protein
MAMPNTPENASTWSQYSEPQSPLPIITKLIKAPEKETAQDQPPTTPSKRVFISPSSIRTPSKKRGAPATPSTSAAKRPRTKDSAPNTPGNLVLKSPAFRRTTLPVYYEQNDFSTSGSEWKRLCEAVMKQVDWFKVQESVASNRPASVYKHAIKKVLQDKVDEVYRRDPAVEHEDVWIDPPGSKRRVLGRSLPRSTSDNTES